MMEPNNPYEQMAVRNFLLEQKKGLDQQKKDRWKTDPQLEGQVPYPADEPVYIDLQAKILVIQTLLSLTHIPELMYVKIKSALDAA